MYCPLKESFRDISVMHCPNRKRFWQPFVGGGSGFPQKILEYTVYCVLNDRSEPHLGTSPIISVVVYVHIFICVFTLQSLHMYHAYLLFDKFYLNKIQMT